MKKLISLLLSAIIVVGLMLGCKKSQGDISSPDNPCDSSTVTYSGTVVPILREHCNNCHGGPTVYSYRLDSYDGVRAVAASGKLYGSIAHIAPFIPMPLGDAKMSDCNIAVIKKWIEAGFPNN